MRSTTPRPRTGSALDLVLFPIVLISLLIAGAWFTAMQEFRVGRNSLTQVRALTAAEFGQDSAYSGWDKKWNSFRAGSTFVRAYAPGDGSVDTVRITKLNSLSFLIVSEGRAGSG